MLSLHTGLSSGQFRPVRSRPKSVMGHLRDIHYCQAAGSIEGEAASGVVAPHAVGVMHALPFGAVARQ